MELSAGQVLGRYELLMPIAKGGMAQVWAARLRGTRGFQKLVAMKTILAGVMDDSALEHMFLEEATLASQIHHPNVVETLELGEQDGTLYLAMEWADGESLQAILREAKQRGLIPLPIAINLVGQACKGLHAAHDLRDDSGAPLGLVHRDISPHNVLVTYSGTVKLVDFGIAKAMNRSSGLTDAGQVKGKCAYMAPEQMKRELVDRRADIFGMGIVLYQLTTGRHPFRGEHPAQTIENIVSTRPTLAPSKIVRDYPMKLEHVVLKALRKNPNERWSTARELLEALEHAMPGCLEASFESDVQEFLKSLFGERAAKRKAALKSAQEQLDKQGLGLALGSSARASAPDAVTGTGSSGIGPAIGVGVGGTGTSTGSSLRMQGSSWTQLGAEVSARPKLLVSLAGAATVLGIVSVVLALVRPFGSEDPNPELEAHAAAQKPSAPEPAAPVQAAKPEVDDLAVSPLPPAEDEQPEERKRAQKSRAGARALPPSSPAALPALPAAAPKSSPETATAAPKASAKSAWDRDAFGGRQ